MRCPARLRAMTLFRSAGSYLGDAKAGGGGAAALVAQVLKTGAGLNAATNPSDAIVDDEGVRGKAMFALAGIGLSRTWGGGAGNRPGRPGAMSKTFEAAVGVLIPDGWIARTGGAEFAPNATSLESRKRPGNFFVRYGSGSNSFSNGTPSSKMTLLTISGLSEHSSRTRAYLSSCEQPNRSLRQ
jgi:hypothetical protein